jgi:hypothetical protein
VLAGPNIRTPLALALTLVAALGCAGQRGDVRDAEPSVAPPRPAAESQPSQPPHTAQSSATQGDAGASPTPEAKVLAFRRVLETPVHSLALGEKSHVAALGVDAFIDRGKGFEKLPKPPKPTANVQIYFGRDNLPRLMGYERTPSGEASVYYRFRGGSWERGASEIGRLAGAPAAALYGVLGHADPEVVCKRGDQCIIKRRSGWTMLPPLPQLPRVVLCEGQAWAFEDERLWALASDGWRELGGAPAFSQISAVWGTTSADVLVADGSRQALHRLAGGRWTEQRSPIDGPRALWAAGSTEIWLAGDGGVAHHDGASWRRVSGAPLGALVVAGRSAEDVWLAGASGVWRGTKP